MTLLQTPSKKKLEIMTISSNYHIEVNPSDVNIYDKVVVMDLVKMTAQTHQIDPSGQREFKGRKFKANNIKGNILIEKLLTILFLK